MEPLILAYNYPGVHQILDPVKLQVTRFVGVILSIQLMDVSLMQVNRFITKLRKTELEIVRSKWTLPKPEFHANMTKVQKLFYEKNKKNPIMSLLLIL